jgi:hypothetical protein
VKPEEILDGLGVLTGNAMQFGVPRDSTSVCAMRDRSGVVYLSDNVAAEYASPFKPQQRDDWRRFEQFAPDRLGLHVDEQLDFGAGDSGYSFDVGTIASVDPVYRTRNGDRPFAYPDLESFAREQKPPRLVTAFHVLEHLGDPVRTLQALGFVMADGGRLIAEVPHARDWLLVNCEAFRAASLWTQHLILHTRDSLAALLEAGGFEVERIEGYQRYPLSNHIQWLAKGVGGCMVENETLDREYAATLARQDANDTLIAWARKR